MKTRSIIAIDITCVICLDDTDDNKIVLSCKHAFCEICLTYLIDNKNYNCVLCKKNENRRFYE